MLRKQCFAPPGLLHDGDVMRLWILQPQCHTEGLTRCINLGWIKYDVTEGLGVECTGIHWSGHTHPQRLLRPSGCQATEEPRVLAPPTLPPADHVGPVLLLVGPGAQQLLQVQTVLLSGEPHNQQDSEGQSVAMVTQQEGGEAGLSPEHTAA